MGIPFIFPSPKPRKGSNCGKAPIKTVRFSTLAAQAPVVEQVVAIDDVDIEVVEKSRIDHVLGDVELRARFYLSLSVILSRRRRHISSYLPVFLPKTPHA